MKSPNRILVVDDEETGRFVKSQILQRASYAVLQASTGLEALAVATREQPDLIVLDVNLPDISGHEVCRRLKADAALPALQILHVSNTAISNQDRIDGLGGGADAYLTEPVDPGVLLATVNALLRTHAAERALADAVERERQARQAAEDANRLKDEFLAALSHELRTPLNAIAGWVWQLRHSQLDEPARARALESLERNTKLQVRLIDDLLDVARSVKGKLHLDRKAVDLGPIVHAAIESSREAAAKKNLTITTCIQSADVNGDAARLQQVVSNLLTNAIRFTPAGGRIDVTVERSHGHAQLRIADSGIGIDAAFLPHVFDPFRQAEAGTTRQHGGLGLGLAIVHQLVELHGGTVSAASDGIGRGATFLVELPLAS